MKLRTQGRIILLIAYLLVFSLTWWTTLINFPQNAITGVAFFFFYSTFGIFIFSFIVNNSSMFDAYWIVMPVCLLTWFFMHPAGHFWQVSVNSPEVGGQWMVFVRLILVFLLILAWGTRLTWNFLRGWQGLEHEDWRYRDLREKTGKFYWPVSLIGIHLFPAFIVFTGCLPLWVIFYMESNPINMLDLLAVLVTGGAILLEARADKQLHTYLQTAHDQEETMREGLWAITRHPNYLGEISFWWGLFFFGLAANTLCWWIIAGPILITVMFVFISIPMIEKRMIKRRTDYSAYKKQVSMLLPLPMRQAK